MGFTAKRGFLFQIWRSFILFILIPVVLLNAAIFYMLYDMENTARRQAMTRMLHARFLLDQNITDSLVSLDKIGGNYYIQKMSSMKKPLTPADYGTLWKVKEFRQSMVMANDAYSINILCNGSDIFMTEGELCMDLSAFYHDSFEFGQVSLEELKEYGHRAGNIAYHPYSVFKNGTVERKGIFYTTVMTAWAGEDSGATGIVFLNEENLEGIFGEFEDWNSLTYIMDADGRILYQIGNEKISPVSFPLELGPEIVRVLPESCFGNGNFAMISSVTTGLQIVSVIPESSLYMQMGGLKIFIWILNITTIFMSLFLSLLLAKRRSRILSGALELMEHEESGEENVFSALYNSVSSMVETNASLKHELGAQKELLQSVFWNRLLSMNNMSDEEIRHLAVSAGVRPDAAGYCLLLLGFGNEHDMGAEDWNLLLQKRLKVLEEISGEGSEDFHVGSCGIDQLVVLLPLTEEEREDYQNQTVSRMSALQTLLEQDAMLLCVGSTVFESLRDMHSAYTMCCNQMNLRGSYREPGAVLWCSEEELGTEATFYYTDELKNQIVLWIKSGQQELVKGGFRRILEDNYLKRRISGNMEQLLTAKLKLTLLGAYDSRMTIDLADVFEQIDKIQTDAWLFSYILRVAMDMCGHYMAGIRSHEDGLQRKMVAYIEEHFTEYGFGLGMIAEYCNLSETYFSQIFKEIMGENFSAYVEKKRMAYAYQMIVETELTIDAVAEKTGYSNANAFRKAYKRFYGISPSQSRKNTASE